MPSVDILLAAYNGEKYLREQLDSVFDQNFGSFRIIARDDGSDDATPAILEEYERNHPDRFTVIRDEKKNLGCIGNFSALMARSDAEYTMFCDQDDVWLEGKVKAVMGEFNNGADVVLHDADIVDGELNPTGETAFKINGAGTGIIKNIVKNSYQGSCMAFRASLKQHILPFPDSIPMHDQWIGLTGEKYGKVALIRKSYILYRRHGENVSGNGSSLMQKIKWRIAVIGCLLK